MGFEGVKYMYLITEICFHSGKRKSLPLKGYRPDIIVDNGEEKYWGISFIDFEATGFDMLTYAEAKFTFQEVHYAEVYVGQSFRIMEGPHEVGMGTILSIEND